MSKPEHYNVTEAAAYLGLSVQKVRKLIRTGDLPAADYGDVRPYYVMARADLDGLRERRRVRPVCEVEPIRQKAQRRRRHVTVDYFAHRDRKATA